MHFPFQDWVTATDIRVVFNRLLTPDADVISLAQEMQSLANAPSVKFNSQLSLDKEAVVHYVHNESSNSLSMDSSSGPMTLNLAEGLDGSDAETNIFKNGFSQMQVRKNFKNCLFSEIVNI